MELLQIFLKILAQVELFVVVVGSLFLNFLITVHFEQTQETAPGIRKSNGPGAMKGKPRSGVLASPL